MVTMEYVAGTSGGGMTVKGIEGEIDTVRQNLKRHEITPIGLDGEIFGRDDTVKVTEHLLHKLGINS